MGMKWGLSPIFALLLASLLAMATTLLSFGAHAGCSSYAGAISGPITSKISINEYNYSGGYIELKIIDPTILADTSNLNGWRLSLLKKSGGGSSTRTNYTVSSYLTSCGAGSQYIQIPTGTLGNDSVVVLWSDSGMTQEVDYFRIGQSSYPTFQPSTCFASSEFPSTSSVTWHQGELAGSSARKDIARGPDGTGMWIETPYNGSDQGTPCDTNDGTLAITKSVTSASTAYVGEQVSFRVSVSLNGRADIQSSVMVTDLLPSGLAYVSHSASTGTYTSGTGVWAIGSLSSGASATLDITVKVTQVGTLTNSATVQSTDFPSGTVTPATASVTALQPLTLAKAVSPSSVPYNTAATFTVSVKNNSSATLPSGFTVNDTVPSGLTAGSPLVSSGSYAGGVWTIPSGMPAGAIYTLTLSVTSQTTAGSFTNTATAVAPFGGSNLTASATLVVGLTVSNFNVFEATTAAGAITGQIYTKLAGSPFSLDVVAISAGAQANGFSGNVKLELLANTGTPGSGYGTDNCPTSNSVIQTIASAALAGGRSAVSFPAVTQAYRDVRVRVTYSGVTPNCSNDSFAIRPSAVTLATIPAMAIPPSAAAPETVRAGASFTLMATTSSGTNYAGALAQDTAKLAAQDPVQTSKQNGGVVGTLTPASLIANATSSDNATYSEVGYLYLAPGAFRDDSYTSVDQPAGCTATNSCDCVTDTTSNANLDDAYPSTKYGCSIGNKTEVSFGRFIPDHFLVTQGAVTNRVLALCSPVSTFTYAGEEMQAKDFNLTAYNGLATPTVTKNYSGIFARFDGSVISNFGFGVVDLADSIVPTTAKAFVSGTGPGEVGLISSSGSWAVGAGAGVGTFSANLKVNRALTPDGPYESFRLGIAPVDADGVTIRLADNNLDITAPADGTADKVLIGSSVVRFGRLKLSNAYGSDTANLNVPAQAQYWSGLTWVINNGDSCTKITKDAVKLTSALSANNVVSADVTLNNGTASIVLKCPYATCPPAVKPVPPLVGSVGVCVDLGADPTPGVACSATSAAMPWLQGKWPPGANYDNDPSAKATFGIYAPETKKTIHVRELY